MAFTPSENPITNPTRESYTELRPFRFWCQKVLPLVYDDSLSYYELLCKVVDYLNKTMEDVDHMNTDMDTLYSNFQEFQEGTFRIYNELVDYVNTYFDELDVQEEINNKLDDMVTSGELVTILQPSIADEVASWLSEHITPTTPAIDDTLTVQGAGADAKVVGDKFKKVVQDVTGNNSYTDANNVNENCIIFNSSVGGELIISNTPTHVGWLQTNYTNERIAFQIYYVWDYYTYEYNVFVRSKRTDGWHDWKPLANGLMTQRKVAPVNTSSGDLNDYTDNCFTFISSPNTISNLPIPSAGALFVNNFDNTVYQMYVEFTYRTVYVRFKVSDTWNEWSAINNHYFNAILNTKLSKIVQDITGNNSYTDANDINENCIIFNSSEGGVLLIANTPQHVGWLQTNYTNDNIILQIYYTWDYYTYEYNAFIRSKRSNGWATWRPLASGLLTQRKVEPVDINNGDLNNYTENCFTFISSPNTIANLPTPSAGVLFVNNFDNAIYQMYVEFTNKTIYVRFKLANTWREWTVINNQYFTNILNTRLTKIVQDITGNNSYTDANDINENCIIFNSSEGGVLNMVNTPAYTGWLQTNYTNNNIIMQIYYPWDIGGLIKYRNKTFNGWTNWRNVNGNIYQKNVTENTIENTYNITTTPTITTDSNGWLSAIDDENTSENNATDMAGAILSLLTNTGYCHLSEGVFFVSGNIDMPEGSLLEGCGEKTVIKLLNSSTNAYICRLHTKSTIKNIRFCGNFTDIDLSTGNIGGRTGIAFVGNRDGEDTDITPSTTTCCIIDGCWFDNLDNAIYCHNSGGGLQEGLICNNCYITQCKCGININYWCEYCKFTNIVIFKCYYGCINNGGNNVFTSCTFHGTVGFMIDNSLNDKPNNGHGSVIGCTFNHIDNWNRPSTLGGGVGIKIVNMQNGFVFTGCQMFYGSIEIENSKGVQLSNFLFGGNSNAYNIDSNSPVFFNDCVFLVEPDLTNVSTNTKFIQCYNANNGELVNI